MSTSCYFPDGNPPHINTPHYDVPDDQITKDDQLLIQQWYIDNEVIVRPYVQIFKIADYVNACDIFVWRFHFTTMDEQALFRLTFNYLLTK